MIQDDIKKLLCSDKPLTTKAIELMIMGKLICDELNKPEFANAFVQHNDRLKSEINIVNQCNEKIKNEISNHEELRDRYKEINEQHKELLETKKNLKTINEKKEALTNLSNLQEEISKGDSENNALIEKQIKTFKQFNELLAKSSIDLEKELAERVETAIQNLLIIQNKKIEVLKSLSPEPLKIEDEIFAKQVSELIKSYNEYANKINEYKKTHEQVAALYNQHHLENENITEALKKRGIELKQIEELKNDISEKLNLCDIQIRALIEKRDQLPIYQLEETRKYQL